MFTAKSIIPKGWNIPVQGQREARHDRNEAAERYWTDIFAQEYPQSALDNGIQTFPTED